MYKAKINGQERNSILHNFSVSRVPEEKLYLE